MTWPIAIVAAMVIFCAFSFALEHLKARARRLEAPHVCSFVPIDSQIHRVATLEPLQVMTVLLRRCSVCCTHQTFCLNGEWTLSQLVRKESELSELERIAKR